MIQVARLLRVAWGKGRERRPEPVRFCSRDDVVFFLLLSCVSFYCKETQNQLYTQCVTCNSVKNYGKKCDFAEISGKIKRRLSLCQDGWMSRFTGCGEELFMLLCV